MYIPFQELTDQAYIWVYQSDRRLTLSDTQSILEQAKFFLETWSSHGRPLLASAEIRYDYFLILGIQQSDLGLTCCTTDSAIQFLHTFKASMGINFLDRSKIVLQEAQKCLAISIRETKEKIQQGIISQDIFTFDNTITKKQDLETRWLIPIQQAWFNK